MSITRLVSHSLVLSALTLGFFGAEAQALDLDWQGQFRVEANSIYGYSSSPAVTTPAISGYSIPANGDSPASFQNLFLSLKPRVLVNDNVTIYSDLWVNTPSAGFFGSNSPVAGSFHYSSTEAGNGALSARTLYAEVATDFGIFKAGRIPLNYGLGLVWNSGASRRSRMPSNGDALSLNAKFGAFKFTPYFVKYGQDFSSSGSSQQSGRSDYALNLSYTNDDEQLDLGLLFLRRIAGPNSGVLSPFSVTGSAVTSGYVYNIWDLYAKKRSGIVTVSGEIPISSGLVASVPYNSIAGALKAEAAVSDHFKLKADFGTAAGQGSDKSKLTSFAFHPDYRPGLLMFNYNLFNLATNNGNAYYNPVTNTRYFSLGGEFTSGKFTHEILGLLAIADQVSDGVNPYFNTWQGYYTAAASDVQSKGMGFEMDYNLGYDWDEATRFGVDLGLYFPGAYYNLGAAGTPNTTKAVFGTNLSMNIKF